MSESLREAFRRSKQEGRAALMAYTVAGYPHPDYTVDTMLAFEEAGVDIIEIGVPFTDPLADGPTIASAHSEALSHGVDIDMCFKFVAEARERGLHAPVVFMGYYNPIYQYGDMEFCRKAKESGVNGFIIVDLPPEEAGSLLEACKNEGLSYVPLITPVTSEQRIQHLAKAADSFFYVVSRTGVTGAQAKVDSKLSTFLARVRSNLEAASGHQLPLAVGFGISNNQHFLEVGAQAEGVVVGSCIIQQFKEKTPEPQYIQEAAQRVKAFLKDLSNPNPNGCSEQKSPSQISAKLVEPSLTESLRFGDFGGQYVPEALVESLSYLDKEYQRAKQDPKFLKEFESFYPFISRPSSLHRAERLTAHCEGAEIWLKREDLNHTGSHSINNALGQVLLARRLGKTRIICETGAGQHGLAVATVCAHFGIDCVIYMGSKDIERQAKEVFQFKLLGAKLIPVTYGSGCLKDAINEAMRDLSSNLDTTYYAIGSIIGPHPFPTIVKDFQSVIGNETKSQFLQLTGKLPDTVVAYVGGGSNAIGIFNPFVNDKVQLIGVEAAGSGIDTNHHSATLTKGTPGIFHGCRTYLLQDSNGQIQTTHSISSNLNYPGVGPEHCFLLESGRANYTSVTDDQAITALKTMAKLEGIIPSLETSHAIYTAMGLAKTQPKDRSIVICISGRGDNDISLIRSISETN